MRGYKRNTPVSVVVESTYLRLRAEAMDKLPDEFIGFFIRYDKLTRILRLKAISVNEPDVIGSLSGRSNDDRRISSGPVGRALNKQGIREMYGEWNEENHEFTFVVPVSEVSAVMKSTA